MELRTQARFLTKSDPKSGFSERRPTSDLPVSLVRQATQRLRIVAALIVIATLISWVGVNALEGGFFDEFRRPADWIPPVLGIGASVAIFVLSRSSRFSAMTIVKVGLAYQVVVSYSLAVGQYWNTFQGLHGERLTPDLVGVSAVALWMAFFTVLVPARPRNALIALLLSGSAVPVVIFYFIRAQNAPTLPPSNFFFIFILPYVLTIAMCLVAANVIYGLGRDLHEAQRVGSYRLLSLIGRGGMGEVWRAQHNLLARPAAIKLIRPEALGANPIAIDTLVSRFEQEAQVTSSLQSPHTVELYDFGLSEDGSLFYVMELLHGMDLDEFVRRFGPMPAERVVFLLRQVCSSLVEAHRRGLIHRDVKPANIMLCEYALASDFVKVLDFGLVKRMVENGRPDDGKAQLTEANVVAGTPAFAAPEIYAAKGAIDGRADLYSLGCVAFWLLSGRPVFDEETPLATLLAHVNVPPPLASVYAESPIPDDLDRLISQCLAKDPDGRPESAEALVGQLDALSFERPWTAVRAREWWLEHRPENVLS